MRVVMLCLVLGACGVGGAPEDGADASGAASPSTRESTPAGATTPSSSVEVAAPKISGMLRQEVGHMVLKDCDGSKEGVPVDPSGDAARMLARFSGGPIYVEAYGGWGPPSEGGPGAKYRDGVEIRGIVYAGGTVDCPAGGKGKSLHVDGDGFAFVAGDQRATLTVRGVPKELTLKGSPTDWPRTWTGADATVTVSRGDCPKAPADTYMGLIAEIKAEGIRETRCADEGDRVHY